MNRKGYLGIVSGIYAIFYSFCLYKNLGGATFPFFVIGTLFYFWLCTKEFKVTWKKDSIFIMAVAVLIGISQVLTANKVIQTLNVIVVFTLLVYVILHQFAFDENWSLFQTIKNILRTFFGSFLHIFAPFKDYATYRKNQEIYANENADKPKFPWLTVLFTVLCCIPALAIVIALLSSADAVFSHLWDFIFIDWFLKFNFWGYLLLAVIVFFFIYGQISHLLTFPYSGDAETAQKNNPIIAVTAGTLFDTIYVIFSVIQIFYLFIGKFELPEGYSYARYAREGYFQLLFVCVLNLAMVLVGIYLFEETKAVKIILSVLSGCTYIMIASSAFRMILYIRYYYFSFERIFVLWSLVLLTLLLTGLFIQIWKKDFKLFKYSIIVCSICYIVLAFGRPDYCIAKWNLANADQVKSEFFLDDEYEDYYYLIRDLSEDAAPILLKNEHICTKYDGYKIGLQEQKITVRNFNISKYTAKVLANKN